MTLFICFVQSSLLLPTTSPFWNQRVHGSRQLGEQNVSVAQSQRRALGFSAREQQAHRGEREREQLSPHCSSRWSASEEQLSRRNEPVFPPAVRELESSPAVNLDGSDQLPPCSRRQELEVRGAIASKPGGGGWVCWTACPDTLAHTQEDSQAHHYHIL